MVQVQLDQAKAGLPINNIDNNAGGGGKKKKKKGGNKNQEEEKKAMDDLELKSKNIEQEIEQIKA